MLEKNGEEICGIITESNAIGIGSSITSYFSHFSGNAQIDAGNFDRFIGALAFVFAKCVEIKSLWRLVWINLSEKNQTDGVYALVNKDHSLLVYPIGLMRGDFLKNTKNSESFFRSLATEIIADQPLPKVPSGSFLDLGMYLKDSNKALWEIESRNLKIKLQESPDETYSDVSYRSFLKHWNFPLPEDYLNFLRSGAKLPDSGNAFFWVIKDDWGSELDEIYTMQEHFVDQSLMKVFDWKGIPLVPRMLPIGGDGCFGYVLMSFRAQEIGAIYYCTTYSERGALREGGEYYEGQGYWKIAKSFLEFVDSLTKNPDE